jgi:hypothetical protein
MSLVMCSSTRLLSSNLFAMFRVWLIGSLTYRTLCLGFSSSSLLLSANFVVLVMLYSFFKFVRSLNLSCMCLAIVCVGA